MRRRPTEIGEECAVAVRLELDDVGRREVVGDEDRLFLGSRGARSALFFPHALQGPVGIEMGEFAGPGEVILTKPQ